MQGSKAAQARALGQPAARPVRGLCNAHVLFLSQLLPYPGLLVAAVGRCPQPCLCGAACSFIPPPLFGDFIYYLSAGVLFGDSGFYFSAGFDRYSGKGGGAFGFVL